MRPVLFSLLFWSVPIWADCELPNGRRLSEGSAISLLAPGKSMANFKTQDQDGLGTCYANAASAILQSVLPGNPEVSYLHAATQSATKGWRQNWEGGQGRYMRSGKQAFPEGGFFCETIAGMKKSGGACPKKYSLLENPVMNPQLQSAVFKNLGTYFDILKTLSPLPQQTAELRRDLAKSINSLKLHVSDIQRECELERNEPTKLYHGLSMILSDYMLQQDAESACGKSRIANVGKYLMPDFSFEGDRVKGVKPTPAALNEFRQFLMSDSDVKEYLDNIPGNKKSSNIVQKQERIHQMLNLYLDRFARGSDSSCQNEAPPVASTHGMGRIGPQPLLFSGITAQNQACSAAIPFPTSRVHEELNSCIPPARLDILLNAIKPLLEIGKALDDSLIEALMNPDDDGSNRLAALIMPECQDPSQLKGMEDVSCSSFTMCSGFSNWAPMMNQTYEGPNDGCYSLEDAKKLMRTRVYNGISSGRALGIDMCTAFMTDPTARTNFCRNKAPGVPNHGYHAMTIAGYRCSEGQLEYQIINSWGKDCPAPAKDNYRNSALECEVDQQGGPTGRFWLKEEVLVDNSIGVTQILKGRGR